LTEIFPGFERRKLTKFTDYLCVKPHSFLLPLLFYSEFAETPLEEEQVGLREGADNRERLWRPCRKNSSI
jgi:hypothetical protein